MKITILPFLALLGLSQGNAASTTAYTWDAVSGDLSTISGAVFGNLTFTGNANPNLGFSDVEGQGRFFFAPDPNNVPRTISYRLTFTDERSSLVSAMFGSGGITPTIDEENAVVGGNNGMASQFTIDAVNGRINDIGLSTLITGYQTSITTGDASGTGTGDILSITDPSDNSTSSYQDYSNGFVDTFGDLYTITDTNTVIFRIVPDTGNVSFEHIALNLDLVTTVPEPSSAALLGLSALGLLRRRRR